MSIKFSNVPESTDDEDNSDGNLARSHSVIGLAARTIPISLCSLHRSLNKKILYVFIVISALGLYIYKKKKDTDASKTGLTFNFTPPQPSIYDSHIPETYSLKSLCDDTVWHQDVYLNCTDLAGGTFNIQNSIVTCLRWAIDAGIGMIMPKIATRVKDDPSKFRDSWMPYTYLFDENNLRERLSKECPQLILKETNYEPATRVFAEVISYKQYTRGTYRSHVSDLLTFNGIDGVNGSIVVVEANPLLGWLFNKERRLIHISLLDTVRFNPDISSLAKPIVAKLPEKFIGFHLRAEKDFPWYSYESIVTWFETSFQAKYIKNIYVAVGSREVEERFRNSMNDLDIGINVISKWTLASENTTLLSQMNSLRFDQIAIVDYEIMIRSNYFYGVGQSSFAYAIAFQRGNGTMTNCNCEIYDVPDPRFVCCY
jgi:hypothetical protein